MPDYSEIEHMPNPQNRSADPAALEMLVRAGELGAKTVWDRHDDLKPLCGFGELGLCCDVCYMGPCRIDPFGERAQVGACGADAHLIVARNLARAVACGAAAHSDHGREVVEVFRGAAEGGSASGYAISNVEKLMTLAAEWGVEFANRGERQVAADLGARMAARKSATGSDSTPWCVRCSNSTISRSMPRGEIPIFSQRRRCSSGARSTGMRGPS